MFSVDRKQLIKALRLAALFGGNRAAHDGIVVASPYVFGLDGALSVAVKSLPGSRPVGPAVMASGDAVLLANLLGGVAKDHVTVRATNDGLRVGENSFTLRPSTRDPRLIFGPPPRKHWSLAIPPLRRALNLIRGAARLEFRVGGWLEVSGAGAFESVGCPRVGETGVASYSAPSLLRALDALAEVHEGRASDPIAAQAWLDQMALHLSAAGTRVVVAPLRDGEIVA